MKKVFALLIMLAMVMVCGSAMAEIVITGDDLLTGKEKSGTDWSWKNDVLTLKSSSPDVTYVISDWTNGTTIRIDQDQERSI